MEQQGRDDSVISLLEKMKAVYTILTKAELQKLESMKIVIEGISKTTLECLDFIRKYAEDGNFGKLTFY